jgi:hypothetical protein
MLQYGCGYSVYCCAFKYVDECSSSSDQLQICVHVLTVWDNIQADVLSQIDSTQHIRQKATGWLKPSSDIYQEYLKSQILKYVLYIHVHNIKNVKLFYTQEA